MSELFPLDFDQQEAPKQENTLFPLDIGPVERGEPTFLGEVKNSFMNNLYSTTGLLYGGPQAIYGYAAKDEKQFKAGLEKIDSWVRDANVNYPEAVPLEKLVDDPTPQNFLLYAGKALGTIGSTVQTLVAGGVGGGAAIALGIGKKAAERAAIVATEKAIQGGATTEAANAAALLAAKGVEQKAVAATVLAASMPTAGVMNTAETVKSLYEADPGEYHPALALGIGALKTGLDFVGESAVLNSFLKTGEKSIIKDALAKKFGERMANGLVGAMGAAGMEGVTEGLQEVADVVGEEIVNPGKNADLKKLAIRIADSAISGAFAGGAGGVVGGIFKTPEAKAPQQQMAAEVKADQGLPTEAPTQQPAEQLNIPQATETPKFNQDMVGAPGHEIPAGTYQVYNDMHKAFADRLGLPSEDLKPTDIQEINQILGITEEEKTLPALRQDIATRAPLREQAPGVSQPATQQTVEDILAGKAAELPSSGAQLVVLNKEGKDIVPKLQELIGTMLGPQNKGRIAFTDRVFHPTTQVEQLGFEYINKEFGPLAVVATRFGEAETTGGVYHEAFHIADDLGIIPKNAQIIVEENLPVVEKLIKHAHKEGLSSLSKTLESGSWQRPEEAPAYATQAYTYLKNKGLSPGYTGPLRKVVAPLQQFWQRLKEFFVGNGFKSVNDVVNSFATGKYAQKATPAQVMATLVGAPQKAVQIAQMAVTPPPEKVQQRVDVTIPGGKVTPLPPNKVDFRAAEISFLKRATSEVPSIKVVDPGRQMMWHEQWLNHTSAIANKFPAARIFANALFEMNKRRQTLMSQGRALLEPFHDLRGDAAMRVNRLVVDSDANNRFAAEENGAFVLKNDKGQVIGTLTDPKEIAAYNAYRQAGELYKKGLRASLLRALEQPETTTPAQLRQEVALLPEGEQQTLLTNLADALDAIAARNFYMPHMREGSHSITIKDKDGETAYFEKFNLPRIGRQKFLLELEKRLRAAYPISDGYEIGNVVRDVRAQMGQNLLGTVGLVEGLANAFDAKDNQLAQDFFERLKLEMAQRSFKQHLRQRKNIPGYITPATEKDYALIAMDRYIPSVSNFLAKQSLQPEFNQGLKDIQTAKDPRLAKWADTVMNYVMSPNEEAGWLRGIAFHAFLGANLSSAFINLTQIPLAAIPYMGQFDAGSAVYFAKAFKDAMKATDVPALLRGRHLAPATELKYLPQDEQVLVQMAQDNGLISPIQLQNTEAKLEEKIRQNRWIPRAARKGIEHLLTASGLPFAVTEMANRLTTLLAAYRWAKATPDWEQKVRPQWEANRKAGTPLTPEAFATYAVENTQFMMDKANRPLFTQGAVPAVATQFMSYPIQMMELMGNMWGHSGMGARGKLAMAAMLFGLWTLGGLWAQPGAESARRLAEILAKLTGRTINMDYIARGWLQQLGTSKQTAEVLMKGLWRLTGMDISGRVNIDPFKLGNLTGATSIAEVGPAGGAIVGAMTKAIQDYNQDKPWKAAAEFMPLAVRNAAEAFQSKTQGFEDAKGRTIIPPEHVTKMMATMKVAGFTPTEVAELREQKQFQKAIEESQKGRTANYARRVADAQLDIVRARTAGNIEGAQEAMGRLRSIQQEMIESNKGKKLADMINIKGVFDSARTQVATDLTGGYASMLNVKKARAVARPEILEMRKP